MRTVIQIPIDDVTPSPAAILEAQGVPHGRHNHERTRGLALQALGIYREKARPAGCLMETTNEVFASVFHGEGRNEKESPVKPIAEASTHRALFAVTIGEPVCREISDRFRANDFALGSMLDAAASAGADMAAQVLEDLFRKELAEKGRLGPRDGVLRFSPGYCGWHMSSQRKLFDVLRPGELGITLNMSFLMQPLKSVTGAILSGEKGIFIFDDTFAFCRDCTDHTCRDRIQTIMNQ